MTPRARRLLAVAAWLLATALVVFAVRALGWRTAADAMRAARPGWLAAAALCHATIIALWAWQTYVLWPRRPAAPPGTPPPRYATAFEVQALTATATNTAPAFLGQAGGVGLLAARAGLGTAAALGVFAQHNLLEGPVKVLLVLAAARVAPLPPALARAATVVSALALGFAAVVAAAAWWAARRGATVGAPQPAPPAAPAPHQTARHRLRALAAGWAASLDAVRDPRRLLLAFAIAVLMKAAEAAGWRAVERSLGLTPRAGSPVLALAATNLASAVPATPGNLGVYEAAAYSVYHGLLGVPRERALALAVLGHACYLVPLVGTGWALLSARQLVALRARRRGA